jgi:hypothetical protein
MRPDGMGTRSARASCAARTALDRSRHAPGTSEPVLGNVEPDRDDLHRLSLLRSSTATINDAATWSPSAGGINLTLKGHVGMVPIRERNFGQLGAAVRLAYDRVAEIEAFKSALVASPRAHGPMLTGATHDRDWSVSRLASGGA